MSDNLEDQLTQLMLDKGCTVNKEAINTLVTFMRSYTSHQLSQVKDKIENLQLILDTEPIE